METIIVSVQPEESRMGLVSQGYLKEYVVERTGQTQLLSSIYKGRVINVVRGIQAAFVDIGKGQNAFLLMQSADKITEGQSILVQVEKEARGSKGPTVTRNISLAGHYIALHPFNNVVGLSKLITDKAERQRLRRILTTKGAPGYGFVARTAAQGVSESELVSDMERLVAQWKVLEARSARAKAPALLYRELDLPIRIVRDYVTSSSERIIADNEEVVSRIKELCSEMHLTGLRVMHYTGREDIFRHYKLTSQIENITMRRVELAGGGYIIIDHTEAMTVIDVNSGTYSSASTMAETTMAINKAAAVEIARQIQLRDIGGIIVVDFIDMGEEAQQQEILSLLKELFAGDKMKPTVQDITRLNLVEITRRKARQNVATVLYAECPACHGTGRVQSAQTIGAEIRKYLRTMGSSKIGGHNLLLTVHPLVAKSLAAAYRKEVEMEFNCLLNIVGDYTMELEAFSVLDEGR